MIRTRYRILVRLPNGMIHVYSDELPRERVGNMKRLMRQFYRGQGCRFRVVREDWVLSGRG